LVDPVRRALMVQAQNGPGRPIARQVAHALPPEFMITPLVVPIAPAPDLLEAEEHGAARADKLLDDQGQAAVAPPVLWISLRRRGHRQFLGERLQAVSIRIPVEWR